MRSHITINGRRIGPGEPTYIIAELSANHNQELDHALQILEAAHEAGADAVKLQTYTPDTMTLDLQTEPFRIGGGTLWDGATLHELYEQAYMPWEWHAPLKDRAEDLGIDLFSTAYDETAIEFLEDLGIPAHKVASFEIVDVPLIERMAQSGVPLIISTGMATLEEIDDAVQAARDGGCDEFAVLKCTSAYPSPPESMNLVTIQHLAERYGVPIGFSDHTVGIVAGVVAVTLGATLIEKHVTLERARGGPDAAFSLEPHELKQMIQAVRDAEKATGEPTYGGTEAETASRRFRRSLFVVEDVAAGEPFTRENVRSIRPSHGLPPKALPEVLGSVAAKDLERGTPLERSHLRPQAS